MKLRLKDVAWSPLRGREQLRHHESPIARRGRRVEPTLIAASLDLDDEEWAEFSANLLESYPWLEGQGGRGEAHRVAVQVRGPERTIYVDPQGGASGICIGFSVKEQACSSTSTTDEPSKPSAAASTTPSSSESEHPCETPGCTGTLSDEELEQLKRMDGFKSGPYRGKIECGACQWGDYPAGYNPPNSQGW